MSASVKATNNGSAWDGDASAPDPYGSFNDGAFLTAVKQDTYAPTWSGEGFSGTTAVVLAGFSFQLLDSDAIVDDPITANYSIVPVAANFATGSFTVGAVDGAQSITFSISKAP